jgi:dolichol-phosphate mannosyltransferase
MMTILEAEAVTTEDMQAATPAAPVLSDAAPPEVSVIVPALNESANIPLLVPRVAAAMGGRSFEIIIVDDNSKDATPQACAELAKNYPLRLLVRHTPEHGLSGAVLHGIAAARGSLLVVMDADLQHPPEQLPALLAALEGGGDFALGSRYVAGGSTDAQWTLFRKVNSEVATMLARPFAGKVRDPMSGFFAIRRDTVDRAQRLTPLGYKIALELMCKCRVQNVREVPIHFGLRTAGESKLSLKQQFRYLEHLSRLYDFTYPRLSPISKFLFATGVGFVVSCSVFFALTSAGKGPMSAMVLGYLGFILATAVFHLRYVRTQREFLLRRWPWVDFLGIAAAELLAATLAAGWVGRNAPGVGLPELFFISFGCGLVMRYVLRKELLQDIRGLRREPRLDDWRAA